MPIEKPDTVGELRRIALATFARQGIDGTTVQEVADEAGCAKSNVLYHFRSKAGLVQAALEPGVAAFEAFVDGFEQLGSLSEPGVGEAFVDLILEHRLAANLVLNRSGELPPGAASDRIQSLIARLQRRFERADAEAAAAGLEADEALRLGVVMGGVAFAVAGPMSPPAADRDPAELRESLLRIVRGFLRAG